jgi:hypothetical protein
MPDKEHCLDEDDGCIDDDNCECGCDGCVSNKSSDR